MNIPDGWTDDMSIVLSSGKTNEELANFLLKKLEVHCSYESMLSEIITLFGANEDDADLAIDRVQGGIVRALTGNPVNEPDKSKDPLAWHSFQVVWSKLPKKHLFSKYKKPSGKWEAWYNDRQKSC